MRDIQDAKRTFNQPKINTLLPSNAGKPGTEHYREAYNRLNDMLAGKSPMDLKKAVFIVENAYWENKLSYDQYEKHIQNIVKFFKLRMEAKKINPNDNVAKNNLLFRLFSDTLSVKDPVSGKAVTHYPVHYDFDDPFGYEDWSKMFVTKLMATNYGQCHSMPLLYLIIAYEVGAQSYLSTSPSHHYPNAGNYTVTLIVTNATNGCSDTVTTIVNVVTGVEETDTKNGVKIYPNPASSSIVIEYEKAGKFELIDMMGSVQKTFILPAGKNSITVDATDLASGIYTYKLYYPEQKIAVGKLVIIKY